LFWLRLEFSTLYIHDDNSNGKPDLSGYNYGAILSGLDCRQVSSAASPTLLAGQSTFWKRRNANSKLPQTLGTRTSLRRRKILKASRIVHGLRELYEFILSSGHTTLGDQAQGIIWSSTDSVLETLIYEGMKDFDKKKEFEEVIGPIPSEQFSQLLNLSKKVTDYNAEDESG